MKMTIGLVGRDTGAKETERDRNHAINATLRPRCGGGRAGAGGRVERLIRKCQELHVRPRPPSLALQRSRSRDGKTAPKKTAMN